MVAVAGAIWCSQKNMVLIFDILSGCVEVKQNAEKIVTGEKNTKNYLL